MNEAKITGLAGEMAAAEFLRQQGFRIISANFACRAGEIDLIADRGNFIHFIEVKTRKENSMFSPSAAVDRNKEHRIKICSRIFIDAYKIIKEPMYDVVEVISSDGGFYCRLLENKF